MLHKKKQRPARNRNEADQTLIPERQAGRLTSPDPPPPINCPPCISSIRALSHTPASLHINQTLHCKQLAGMVSSQAQLCRSNLELMQTIIQAAREVKKTCQKTFADMRWNCSSIDIPAASSKYSPDLDRGKLSPR